jgi:hypothetical protein
MDEPHLNSTVGKAAKNPNIPRPQARTFFLAQRFLRLERVGSLGYFSQLAGQLGVSDALADDLTHRISEAAHVVLGLAIVEPESLFAQVTEEVEGLKKMMEASPPGFKFEPKLVPIEKNSQPTAAKSADA